VLVTSTFRKWRWFTLLALIFSMAIYGSWYGMFHDRATLAGTEIMLTAIFLIFLAASTLFHIIWRRPAEESDYVLLTLNAATYLGSSLGVMWAAYRPWMGCFTFLLALFYGGLAYGIRRRSPENKLSTLFAEGIAFVALAVAVPVQFGNQIWTTVAWGAEGLALAWLGWRALVCPCTSGCPTRPLRPRSWQSPSSLATAPGRPSGGQPRRLLSWGWRSAPARTCSGG
jgi:hypothetical protein